MHLCFLKQCLLFYIKNFPPAAGRVTNKTKKKLRNNKMDQRMMIKNFPPAAGRVTNKTKN